ncbi:hypothetical protein [Deinococcus rufus]|uniref:Uncharacterized protein n=1 Tax=Deinococcus rufus TaxID=2136097 RepID=A0ABV7Z9S7_9DEIO
MTQTAVPAAPTPFLVELQSLALAIREVNAMNGWGLTFNPAANDQEIPGYLALEHSEIVEAERAALPEDALHELGDVLVRALDFCELLDPGALLRRWAQGDPAAPLNVVPHDLRRFSWDTALFGLHRCVAASLEIYRKEPLYLEALIGMQLELIQETWALIITVFRGTDPVVVIQGICARNMQRGYRHGGRRT